MRTVSVFVALACLAACRGPQQTYVSLPARAEALKQQFNADAGRARIVILPAPN
jgi:uncharacterized lipoprotein YmbA